jgi:hypothetical protein
VSPTRRPWRIESYFRKIMNQAYSKINMQAVVLYLIYFLSHGAGKVSRALFRTKEAYLCPSVVRSGCGSKPGEPFLAPALAYLRR